MSYINRKTLGALLVALVAAAPLVAQAPAAQAPQQTITFDDALRIALEQNGTLRLAKNANAASDLGVTQQKMAFLPDLRLSTSTGQQFGRSFDTNEGQIINSSTQSMNLGVSSSVTVFDGFKNVANLHAAQLNNQASDQDVTRATQTVVFTVASDFVNLVNAQEQLRVTKESLVAQQAQEQQINKYVQAGARPISDLYQQQATVASTQSAVVDATRSVELAKVDLMQALQLNPSGTYNFVAPKLDASGAAAQSLSLDSLLARAMAKRTDIGAQQSRVEAAQQGVKAAQASRWPTVSVSAGYNSAFTTATPTGFVDQLNQRRGGSISLGVSVPVFDRQSASIASQKAQIDVDNARIGLENQNQAVGLQVRRAYLDYQSAQQQLIAAQAEVKAADQALKASQQRYQLGAGTLVELSQAQAAQVKAQSALVSAQYSLLFQKTLVSYYVGDLDPAHVTLG